MAEAAEAGSRYTGESRGEAPELEPGSRKPPEPELVSRPGASEGSRGGSGPADADTEAVGGVTWSYYQPIRGQYCGYLTNERPALCTHLAARASDHHIQVSGVMEVGGGLSVHT